MVEFVLIENLDQFEMKNVLSALSAWSDVFSLNFPLKGYGNNARLIDARMKGLEEFVVSSETFDLGSHASINKKYALHEESLRRLVDLNPLWESWEWSEDMPEDLILYRRDSELVLFEGDKLGETYFAILNQAELSRFQATMGSQMLGKRIDEFESLSKLDIEKPSTSGAIRSYLKWLSV